MPSLVTDPIGRVPDPSHTTDSMHDSFRWLDEDDELDLRLYLDDYHFTLRDQVLAPSKNQGRRPSFRRHLSISKLPFGGRPPGTLSRLAAKDATASPNPVSSSSSSVSLAPGHARRRSRALSLISPNKHALSDASFAAMDPAASHYQDPDARMKLRVYLASPSKFDEAIEFGFPSMEEVQGEENEAHNKVGSRLEAPKLRTFLEDDMLSMYSEASAVDPESPTTPEAMEKSLSARPERPSRDRDTRPKMDYAQAPASSREMTLRMTLTRHDLRARQDDICGWQRGPVGPKTQAQDDAPRGAVPPYIRDGNSKEIMERQFAAIDEQDLPHDNGVVRRLWNRVWRP